VSSLRVSSVYWIFFSLCIARCDSRHPQFIETIPEPVFVSDSQRFVKGCLTDAKNENSLSDPILVPSHPVEDGAIKFETFPYSISSQGNALMVKIVVGINYMTSPETTLETKRRVESMPICMSRFFRRHGLELDISFPERNEGYFVTFRDNGVRGESFNAFNWSFKLEGMPLEPPMDCSVSLHEVGHLFGLIDEYRDKDSLTRMIGEDDSIMRNVANAPDRLKFYPRHLRSILHPACPSI
jgi:hypothetical protein